MIKELEARIHQLSLEVESITKVRQQLEQRKNDLEAQVEKLQAELVESQTRSVVLRVEFIENNYLSL